MNKIKDAIIFASGIGRRLRPLTYLKPKALIEVDGTPIIEKTIDSLFASGISHITIVVGHQSELFFYLKDKFNNVNIIVDDNYTKSLSLSSLLLTTDLMDRNLMIVESDIVIYDSNVLNNEITNSHYLYFTNKFQNDQRGVVTDFLTKRIKEIRAPQNDVYLNNVLFGVSKWLKADIEIVKKEILKAQDENKRLEDIINQVLDDIELYAIEVTNEQVAKIATLEELIEVDSSYLDLKSLELLKSVLKLNDGDIKKVYHSPGRSLNNTNYVVEANNQKYLLRIPGLGTELFCNRETESKAYKHLTHKKFIEDNYFLDAVSGIKISHFYKKNRIIDADSNDDIKLLMNSLRKLHQEKLDLPLDTVFDRIKRYDSFVKMVNGEKYYELEFKKLIKTVMTSEKDYLKDLNVTLIHGDLSPNNAIILPNNDLIFIDLEFISKGDPFMDIANFAHDHQASEQRTLELLEMYLQRRPTNKEAKKLLFTASAISLMWYIWAVYKMTVEDPSRFEMYQSYRDIYLDWAFEMFEASQKY